MADPMTTTDTTTPLSARLRDPADAIKHGYPYTPDALYHEAADALDALSARVAELEAEIRGLWRLLDGLARDMALAVDQGRAADLAASWISAIDAGATIPDPLPLILHCPRCGCQHIDAPNGGAGWTNPPHRSHLCAGCGTIWRPADVPTTGVGTVLTKGKADNWTSGHIPISQHSRRRPCHGI